MSINLNELLQAQLDESRSSDIKEQIKKISERLKDQQINIDWKTNNGESISEILKKLVESQKTLEKTISEAFPNVDAKKIASLLINTPFHHSVSFSTTLKLLNHLNSINPINEKKDGHEDLHASIEVIQPQTIEKENKLSVDYYFRYFVTYIFPFIQIWISSVQDAATTEQLNEIQNQLSELTKIVGNYQGEHSTDYDIDIEIPEDFSGGVKS